MPQVRVKVQISPRLRRNLRPAGLMGPPMHTFLKDVTERMRVDAATNAPEDTGAMKRAHLSDVDPAPLPTWGEVWVDDDAAIFVHEGTDPHWAPVAALQGWADRHGMNVYALQQAIARRGTPPQPWFEEAAERAIDRLDQDARRLGLEIEHRWRA